MKKLLLIVIVIGMFLYVTNPSKSDFSDYIEDEMEEVLKDNINTSSDYLDELLLSVGSFFAGGTAEIAEKLYERDDYLIFSVYTMTIFDEEYRYVGILGQFLNLNNSTK